MSKFKSLFLLIAAIILSYLIALWLGDAYYRSLPPGGDWGMGKFLASFGVMMYSFYFLVFLFYGLIYKGWHFNILSLAIIILLLFGLQQLISSPETWLLFVLAAIGYFLGFVLRKIVEQFRGEP